MNKFTFNGITITSVDKASAAIALAEVLGCTVNECDVTTVCAVVVPEPKLGRLREYTYSLHVYGRMSSGTTTESFRAFSKAEAEDKAEARLSEYAGETMSGDEGTDLRFIEAVTLG